MSEVLRHEGCRLTWTHDMRYVGQGVWQCERCGWEPPEQQMADHTHNIGPRA